jgi:hypothetical protein
MSFLVNIGSKLHQQYRKVNLLQSTEDVSWLTIIKELVLTDDILADSVLKYFTPEVLRQYLVLLIFFCYLIYTKIVCLPKRRHQAIRRKDPGRVLPEEVQFTRSLYSRPSFNFKPR